MIVLSHYCSLQCMIVSYSGWFQPWLFSAMIVTGHDDFLSWLFPAMIVSCHNCFLPWLFPAMIVPATIVPSYDCFLLWLFPAMIVPAMTAFCHDCSLLWLFPPMIVSSSIIDWFSASLFSAAVSLQFVPCNGFTGFAHCSSFLLILATTVPVYACFILFLLLG